MGAGMSKKSRQLVVTLGLAALLLAFGPTSFAKPPGNNGTVKVDGAPSTTTRTTSRMSAAPSRSISTGMKPAT